MTAVAVKASTVADEKELALVSSLRGGLLGWIETHLPSPSATSADCVRAGADLTARLRKAGVFQGDDAVLLSRPAEYPDALLLELHLAIPYGTDGAAYLYQPRRARWSRVLTSERQHGGTGDTLNAVAISPAATDGTHLFLTVVTPTVNVGCVHGFHYAAFRVGPALQAAVPIADGQQTSDTCVPSHVSMRADGFRIDFAAITRDGHRREGVLQFEVHGNSARRVDPVALRPEDFVDEWLARPWSEMESWSAPANGATLRAAHQELQETKVPPIGTAIYHCREADTWQVEIDFTADTTRYFIMLEPTEHAYRMIDVRTTPQPSCAR